MKLVFNNVSRETLKSQKINTIEKNKLKNIIITTYNNKRITDKLKNDHLSES